MHGSCRQRLPAAPLPCPHPSVVRRSPSPSPARSGSRCCPTGRCGGRSPPCPRRRACAARPSCSASASRSRRVMTALLALFAWPAPDQAGGDAASASPRRSARTSCCAYGVVIDPTMMTNVLQTDAREARDLLSLRLGADAAAARRLPPLAGSGACGCGRDRVWSQAGATWRPRSVALAVALLLVLAVFADLSATMRNHRTLRYLINPLNSFYALGLPRARRRGAAGGRRCSRSAPDARLAAARRPGRGRRCSCWWSARRRAPTTSR